MRFDEKLCAKCGSPFRGWRQTSAYCSRHCARSNNRGRDPVALTKREAAKLKTIADAPKYDPPEGPCEAHKGALTRFGYGTATSPATGRSGRAHRVAWEQAYGPIPSGMIILHKCDNRACVKLQHLHLGTLADNNRDRAAKGRNSHVHGTRHPRAKLTEEQVIAIRRSTLPHNHLARLYGITNSTVSAVQRGIIWAHVAPELIRL